MAIERVGRVVEPKAEPVRQDTGSASSPSGPRQVASSAPTDRSIWRVTITNTMPVAMIATETVWIVRLKMLRGVRNRPSVQKLNTSAITTKAPIMPRRRVSTSSVARRLRDSSLGRLGRRVAHRLCPRTVCSDVAAPEESPGAALSQVRISCTSSVAGGRAALDALAQGFLGDPAAVDDGREVLLGDRDRGEEDRVHRRATRGGEHGPSRLRRRPSRCHRPSPRRLRRRPCRARGRLSRPTRSGCPWQRGSARHGRRPDRKPGYLPCPARSAPRPRHRRCRRWRRQPRRRCCRCAVRICSMLRCALAGSQPSV